ncbi:metallophosphoesterase family protein [Kushneria konosiri]|uniref:YfcE family phosphodiesterase n=1 Tax=Kushneria konosiri TaxID=698828 RepID=A0A2Z2HHW7_9GAMM|nr:metallophosphoesterase family protein [Kushneria konosiri]ARS52921.1 YfcE family phosphodiesterase [Kushneria konosiri]
MTLPLCERAVFTIDTPVGVISDTHGLLRDEALETLKGCALILHLGDVGHPEILQQLAEQAPLIAIRGNVDREAWCEALPMRRDIVVNGWRLHLVHDIADVDTDTGWDAVLHGHSHKPRQQWVDDGTGVRRLYFNPGSAGKRRFRLPITAGRLWVGKDRLCSGVMHLLRE